MGLIIPIGFALAWVGYTTGFYGYCLIKGYDITFAQVASPTSFWKQAWPPGPASDTQILPSSTKTAPWKPSSTSAPVTGTKNPSGPTVI